MDKGIAQNIYIVHICPWFECTCEIEIEMLNMSPEVLELVNYMLVFE